ncbi:unnamed protein product [Haemonchus placei]|uniref:Uncharacterized protein n=1 Tax=Haemonchus placei TaxID=6290 RepID=A0A3P7YF76_HAEPC|nr:unnamed protein product [Haemonchus placei]
MEHVASLASEWEDSVIDNIDEEYKRLVEHLYDSARKTESTSSQETTSKTFELMRQRGITRATGNRQQTFDFAMPCREPIEKNLKERRAAIMDKAAEAGKNICKSRWSFANYKTKMTPLRRPDGTVTASQRTTEKVIYDFYSHLFEPRLPANPPF